jgi:hypothetical protein
MADTIYSVQITNGTSQGPYSIRLNTIDGVIATKEDKTLAQDIAYTDLVNPNAVNIMVPTGTTALFLVNDHCQTYVEYPIADCTFTAHLKEQEPKDCSFTVDYKEETEEPPVDCSFTPNITEVTVDDPVVPEPPTEPEPKPIDNGLDIVFVIDITSSMGTAISYIVRDLQKLIDTIIAKTKGTYRFGLLTISEYQQGKTATVYNPPYSKLDVYKNLPASNIEIYKYDQGSSFWVSRFTAVVEMSDNNGDEMKTNLSEIQKWVYDGGSAAESIDMAVKLVAIDKMTGSFRSDVENMIVLVTDTDPSGGDDAYSATDIAYIPELAADIKAEGLKVYILGTKPSLDPLANGTGGIHLHTNSPAALLKVINGL